MRIWSSPPAPLYLGLFIAAYVLGCGFAQSLAIVPGTGISIWPPSGLFIATLVVSPRRNWPWWVLAGCVAELLSNVLWFHSPFPAAVLIYAANATEALVGAWLVNRFLSPPLRLESLREVLAFVVLGAGVAPIFSATIGSATLAWFGMQSQTFVGAWPLWWIGDATGVLIVAPLALVAFQNWRGKTRLTSAQWTEVAILGVIFLGVAILSLSGYLPFAYIIMPPLLWASVRFEFKGAVIALTLLALVTAIFTLTGTSQFVGDAETQKHKQIMLQLFLAISAFSSLIVAAISRQHQLAVSTLRQKVEELRDRERELSQIVNMVPVHIRRLTPKGEPTFFNKRLLDFFGINEVAELDQPGMSLLAAAIKSRVHPEDSDRLFDAVRQAVNSGEPYAMKYRMRRADGVYRWVDGRGEPVRDGAGAIIQWFAISIDIHDEVRAQEALRERERQLQVLTDAVPALIWATTPEGRPSYINKRFQEETGATLEDITAPDGSPSLSVIHPDDMEAARQAVTHSFETGDPYIQRYRQLRSDGSYRWSETRAEPLRDDDGTILQWYGVSVDIHDLVTAQEALQQSERRYRDLFHYMPIGLTQVDAAKLIPLFKGLKAQGVADLESYINENPEFLPRAVEALEVEEVNRHTIAMFNAADAEEMRGPISRYWQPGLATIRRSIEARYRGEEVFQEETKVERMDGSVIDVLFTTARPGAVADKSLVGFIDITERKKAEEALRNREREFSQLVDMVPSLLWRLDPTGEPTFFNKRLMNFLGLDAEATNPGRLDAIIKAAVHAEDAAALSDALNRSLATGEHFALRYRLRRADGVYRWFDGSAEPLRDENGNIVQWYGLSHDVDDQLRAEEAVRESETQLRRLVDALPTQIWAAEANGEPSYLNRRLADYVGLTLADLNSPDASRLQMAIQNSVHPEDAAGVGQALVHSFTTGDTFGMKYRQRRADGAYRWINGRAEPLRDANGFIQQWYGVSFDIDDDVRTQEELRQTQQRLAVASQAASLAELSASIAHEVNQPLAAIVANSHACHRWLSVSPPNVERAKVVAERIIRDANSAADVVGRIRALFKQSLEERNNFALDTVVSQARDLMAEEAARRRVQVDVHVERDLPLVALDPVQIQQVMINLIRNGIEAMASSERDKILEIRVHRVGDLVQTEVIDHGQGLEFPDRVFEPFFTTKDQGMGMGLAICRSIVESHGGRLWAEGNDPFGARFIFTLPVATRVAP
ncbi:MASE1 domain-containing protein [Rhizobium sp. LjRoot254]|uniref:MASE1 domain-containing protein n=1 Tax=Rhizobium sp. LjRoot254 TaxID=3342297 RepID=UPI003ECC7508